MIRPETALEARCNHWEEQIDRQLKAHEWDLQLECEVRLETTSEFLDYLLDRYDKVGWNVVVTEVGEDHSVCLFSLPPVWEHIGDRQTSVSEPHDHLPAMDLYENSP